MAHRPAGQVAASNRQHSTGGAWTSALPLSATPGLLCHLSVHVSVLQQTAEIISDISMKQETSSAILLPKSISKMPEFPIPPTYERERALIL